MEKSFGACADFAAGYVEEHKKTFDEHNLRDLIDVLLLKVRETTDSTSSFYGQRGEYAIINNLVDLFMAGMETTASSLLWSYLYLLHFPECQVKIHQEIDLVIGKSRLPMLDDKQNLHYTNAFLHESLRFAAFVPMSLFHYTTKEVAIRDYVIPKNAAIITSLYHVMYDPDHFKNPNEFRPERFLDQDGKFVPDPRVIPFGIGKRVCLGQSMAEKQFFLQFTTLIQNFRIEQEPGVPLPKYGIDDVHVTGITRTCPKFNLILHHRA